MIQFYELFSLELDKDYLVNHRGVSSNWNLNWTHETRGAVEQNQMMEMGALIQGFFLENRDMWIWDTVSNIRSQN